ncbi:MAG: elongation factor G [Deltaproteobacteria bacterium]|nr:elongation factor G [Deltaproteobacteria bacterium]
MAQITSPEARRNIAVIGQSGIGKTPLCEYLLNITGNSTRIGKTVDGSSHFDFEPEEVKRNSTLKTSVYDFSHQNISYSIIDTPGSSTFVVDTAYAVRAADVALLVIGAISGVKVQGKKAWKSATKEGIARAMFVSELDHENACYENALEAVKSGLGVNVAPLQYPIGSEHTFQGVVDLMTMRAYVKEGGKWFVTSDIPAEVKDDVDKARTALIESISETDEKLLEKYLEGGDISADELLAALKSGFAAGAIIPLFIGSPDTGLGIDALLDAMRTLFPSPLGRKPYQIKAKDGTLSDIAIGAEQKLVAQVFKTFADPFTGQISMVRVISGTINSDETVLNPRTETVERVGKLQIQQGKEHKPIAAAGPGSIVSIMKLKDTKTGDTLCAQDAPRQVASITIAAGCMSFAIEPKSRGDEEKISSAIEKIMAEDPSISMHREIATSETLVTCMGQQHIDITVERIKRKFNVEVVLHPPKVPYRETIKGQAEAQGKHKKQSGGRGQYGDCWLRIKPLKTGENFAFHNEIFGGAVPKNYVPAIEKGVMEAMGNGYLAGFPMVKVDCAVYDGSYHEVDSSDMAFKIAASKGFKIAVSKASPILLEPTMAVEVTVPDDVTGDIIGDINVRRGRILGMEPDGAMQVIKAEVPLAEMLTYAADLGAMTSDRGSFTMDMRGYEEVPAQVALKVIADNASRKKAEEEE